MIERGSATEHEMALAFLKAELNSPRFSGEYQIDRILIDSPDLESSSQNAARLEELKRVKGALLLPNVAWQRVALERSDLPRLKYLNHPHWIELSGGTRLVSDGAKKLDPKKSQNTNVDILAVADAVKTGVTFPELIAVIGEEQGADIILIEGHLRATAYALAGWPGQIACILGTSSRTQEWDVWYGQRARRAAPPV